MTEHAHLALVNAATGSLPLETGGILLGVKLNGRPCVVSAIEIPSKDRSRAHYRLPGGQTKKRVIEARKVDGRVGYLGEWHSHPADVGPSAQDRGAMRLLSYVQSSPCPLLIVARLGPTGYYLDVRQSIFFTLQKRSLRLVGELPASGQ